MAGEAITPRDIVDFWFPDGPNPQPERHMELWMWRMRGGAHDEIVERYCDVTRRAAEGELDDWAGTPLGRLALIIVLDQFSRSVWAGKPEAYAQDSKALALCLEGLENGDFDALEHVWYKVMFTLPMEHCECDDHLANMDRVIEIRARMKDEAPSQLRDFYQLSVDQPKRHRAVIAKFGRHSHRNDVLGRPSTPAEREYIDNGEFPHQTDLSER